MSDKKNSYSNDKTSNSILVVGRSVLLAFILSIICITVYGVLLTITGLSEAAMPTVILIVSLASIALSSAYAAMRTASKGWLNGAIVGLVYMFILLLLSLIFKTGMTIDRLVLFRMLIGVITGALAGIIGINLR